MARPSKKTAPSKHDSSETEETPKKLSEHQTRRRIEDILEQREFDKQFEI
ncbi:MULTISPECIES: PA3496 family putative envelope integrity protein [Vibrio]|uniref:Adenosine deaminase n=1 Tax=Vibrio ostreae TaxID=2841925 RepID=A0A975UBA8_9VIBR|nr:MULTISPECIES: hypothetical protein [Vibrio]QXO18380.1 hypothetical protein KNV97_08930 [Vibrio ostreae]WGY47327.1 hypothetical protein J0X00_06515 [Vibrio sp. ABG19]